MTHENGVKRYDKLFIDNEPYVWDEEEGRVLPARFTYKMPTNSHSHRPEVVLVTFLPGVFLPTGDLPQYKTSTGGKDKIEKSCWTKYITNYS